ncbi:amidohydrolase family protein [Leifsonia sp. F6_8S_P_1B]|uniref:Amidohydrolase family protein n=1 Tax=Leifsonia williamsii TaxID=3035919 RepID=A0ABT8K6J4_9MICO|nr:amidohydrolase family protein [Leifsonia williamsii]MDN4613024.1 amidohydrolase family protein [Leifsonia williamsii]
MSDPHVAGKAAVEPATVDQSAVGPASASPAPGTRIAFDAVWTGTGFLPPTVYELVGDRLHRTDLPVTAASAHPGGTLFPRLTDHHTHLGLTDRRAVFSGGITHAVDLGWVPSVAASWLAEDAALRHPAAAIAGALITAPGGYPVNAGWGPPGSSAEVGGPREARQAVREQLMRGASRIKVTLNTEAGETVDDATLAALVEEAHAAGVPVTVHVQGDGQTARAVRAGADQLAHTPFTERVDDELVREAVRRGMTWVTTLDIHGWGDPTPQHGIALDNLRRFTSAGGRALYGTDLGNGPLPDGVDARELGGMVEAGMTTAAILQAIAGSHPRHETVGPRLAWVPTPPPGADSPGEVDAALPASAVPAWLATARGLLATDFTTPTPTEDAA